MAPPLHLMIAAVNMADWIEILAHVGIVLLLWLLCWLGPLLAVSLAAHSLVSLPLRRQERARFFLDLLETALDRGGSMEQTLSSMAESGDPALGIHFQTMGAYLKNGRRLSEGLDEVPRVLPPKISAMLKAGERIGDLRKVLPACRQLAGDVLSQTRGAVHYLAWFGFVFTPFALVLCSFLLIKVVPMFREVMAGMGGIDSTWLTLLLAYRLPIFWIQLSLLAVIWLCAIFYIGGPRLSGWLQSWLPPVSDWAAYHTPWKRKRMQRDFSVMLAVLLDSDMPEPAAVELAAGCTSNEIFRRHAKDVVARMQNGVKLTEAVQALDDSGEFRWRLANAAHAHSGFLRALAGWCESLDAKAYQQEQAAALTITSTLVVLNGVFTCLVALAAFGSLVAIIQAGVLW